MLEERLRLAKRIAGARSPAGRSRILLWRGRISLLPQKRGYSGQLAAPERIEDSKYWLAAQGVTALSCKCTDKEWLAQFWGMLKGADLEAQLIRAHIEYDVAN